MSDDLHNAIMNLQIPMDPKIPSDAGVMLAYKLGHRDARHAATELALAAPSAVMPAAPSDAVRPCEYCDDTGDVHGLDGEWRGVCICPAGVALAQPVQEVATTPAIPKGDLSKVWQAADDVCEWLNYEVSEKSPGLLKSIETLNEAMGRAEIRAGRAEPAAGEQAGAVDIDALAQEIRRVDGSNSLGAGALAEALMPFLSAPGAAIAAREQGDSLIFKLECFIDHATGGKLSKSSWALETLKAAHDEYVKAREDAAVAEVLEDTQPATVQQAAVTDAQLSKAAYKGYDEEDMRAYAQSALESERQAHAAEVERLRGDAERMPAEMATRIQVSFCPGAWDTFIYGVSGHLTMEALTAIDASIRDEDSGSLFDKGTGDYLLSAHYFKGQYGFDGRCEIAPGWELSVISFTPLDAAIDQAIARGTK